MAAKAAFGKRGVTAPARVPLRRASDAQAVRAAAPAPVLPGLEIEPQDSALEVFQASGIPAFTITLVVLLCVIFMVEIQHSTDLINPLEPGLDTLKNLGAV